MRFSTTTIATIALTAASFTTAAPLAMDLKTTDLPLPPWTADQTLQFTTYQKGQGSTHFKIPIPASGETTEISAFFPKSFSAGRRTHEADFARIVAETRTVAYILNSSTHSCDIKDVDGTVTHLTAGGVSRTCFPILAHVKMGSNLLFTGSVHLTREADGLGDVQLREDGAGGSYGSGLGAFHFITIKYPHRMHLG